MDRVDDFEDLMRRIRAGDGDAAAELVRRFEPEIRRKARAWLRVRGPEQRGVFESMDICQSVLGAFFHQVAESPHELTDPEQVLGLLMAMVRRKVSNRVRDGRRRRRDARRNRPLDAGLATPTAGESPSRVVANRDLLRQFEAGLSDQESRIAQLRLEGAEWSDVAAAIGGTAESRRKQWSRTLIRAARRLDLSADEA